MQSETNTLVEEPRRLTETPPVVLSTPVAAAPRMTAGVITHPLLPTNGPVVLRPSLYLGCKRVLDVGLAVVLLVLTAPVLLIACLLVKLTSRGPVLYSQTRVGRGGRPFTIWKVRSMYHNAEATSGIIWARKADPRVMPIGRFLRRTHIDELPQLWNILCGDMSLIGPRPERPEFVPQLEAAIPRYRERLLVLPGVTGLAQIHLAADSDLPGVERKLTMDLYYVKHLGFWMDARIFLATIVHVIKPQVADKWFFRLTPRSCADDLAKTPRKKPD